MRTHGLSACTHQCAHFGPSCCILHPQIAQPPHELNPLLHPMSPCTALFHPTCAFGVPIERVKGTRRYLGTLMAHHRSGYWRSWGRSHHVPTACPKYAQAVLNAALQHLPRVLVYWDGARSVQLSRAWARAGEQAVLRVKTATEKTWSRSCDSFS